MKYKTIMLNLNSYSRLASAKDTLSKRLGIGISFNDLILELVSSRLEFLDINDELKGYIGRFVDRIKGLDYVLGALLYGSAAKGAYNEYSDIDVLVLTKQTGKGHLAELMSIAASMKEDAGKLMDKGLPSLISPILLSVEDLKTFRPFYLDVADYGVVLYEKEYVLSDFIYKIKKIRHKRELINNAEVLTWG